MTSAAPTPRPAGPAGPPFPSLVIGARALVPHGSFAEAQAAFLQPDAATVAALGRLLEAHRIGVVAHFYMDAELQGVLSACDWPHIHVSDSLAMADAAVKMAEAGVGAVVVLGVDFMSENVRAVLDATGHASVPVYRAAAQLIGCSLAESAEAREYGAWLTRAARTPHSLHVIYINTSLRVKAMSQALVPTITCTSSNVVQTLLQAAAQIPDVTIWYGPDTYMGRNLEAMLAQYAALTDAEIAALHPAHGRASLDALRGRFHYFEQGVCIVHHLFGAEVTAQVRRDYPDAFYAAHLEVPGEMFALAAAAARHGRGVVGSTSNILSFIAGKVAEAVELPGAARLRVVLGTEAGMITPIVRKVQETLRAHRRDDVEVEIIFPVASEAVAQAPGSGLGVIPGVAAGEGCSTAGGCATCPYMKMNSLEALLRVCEAIGTPAEAGLAGHAPRRTTETVDGRTIADLGGEPILYMRAFQRSGALPDALVAQVLAGGAGRPRA
jgi:quinolinate synthase